MSDSPQESVDLAGYEKWRQERLAERMQTPQAIGLWNHLITVVVVDTREAGAQALTETLASLNAQNYRNIEIIVTGADAAQLPDADDFLGLRGLFLEPALEALTVLSEAGADHLWRGSHVVFASAGTTFDPDAFALLNGQLSAIEQPDLIVCDHDRRVGPDGMGVPCFLPGWDPDLIEQMDYIATAFMASRQLVLRRRPAGPLASLHDWLCALANDSLTVAHLTEPIMHLLAPMPEPSAAGGTALPLTASVAVIIPNRDQPELLRRCVRFLDFFQGPDPEVVIVDHDSTHAETLATYADLQKKHRARLVKVKGPFNFARMVNLGVAATTADVVILINNDVEITRPGEVEKMVANAVRPEVGVVGARLLYPDGTVQHAGMALTWPAEGTAQHAWRGAGGDSKGYLHALITRRNVQVVTGALMATRRDVFDAAEGFDEISLPIEQNDVDYCLRVRSMGLRVIVVPTDGIIHRESSTRGLETTPEILATRRADARFMQARWGKQRDLFCNPHIETTDAQSVLFPWSQPKR
ncbi:glycosyltransferase [Mesorhizobium sp. CU2]|uniref:glycosyltransferase family 2 protein n=1 Tax=unclassified Mesorhizobium TaxID=325217 RepID=UPI00112CCFCD|nr:MULTISPECIES: glycosyltransferase [unclassified Mesorhizobium]TPN89687.1 glycosyltransferase [Mesorhizobium sp. CU3]TPO21415.1 glycosyltransferase [Mesorhizobium sp. CU2]